MSERKSFETWESENPGFKEYWKKHPTWTLGQAMKRYSKLKRVKAAKEAIAKAGPTDWDDYEKRVQNLEAEGLTRSDAQAVADAELMKGKV